MTYVKLAMLEARAVFRSAVPYRAIRIGVTAMAASLGVLSAVMMLILALNGGRTPTQGKAAITYFVVMLGFGLAVGVACAAALRKREARGSIWRLAPLPVMASALLPLTAVILLCAMTVAVPAVPALVAAAVKGWRELALALWVAALAVALSASLSILLVALSSRVWGDGALDRIGSGLPGPIIFSLMALTPTIGRISSETPAVWVFPALTAAVPWIAQVAARQWTSTLATSRASSGVAAVPVWGHPRWLKLLTTRTAFLWAVAATFPMFLLGHLDTRQIVLIAAPMLPMLAVDHQMQWEREAPDRIRLAPRGRQHVIGMMAAVGGPGLALLLLAFVLINPAPLMVAALSVLAIAALGTTLIRNRVPRVTLQLFLLLAVMLTVLPNWVP